MVALNYNRQTARFPDWHSKALLSRRCPLDRKVEAVPDELLHIRELVVKLSADGIVRKFSGGTITLQGAAADLEHL